MATQQRPANASSGTQQVLTPPEIEPLALGCAGQLWRALVGRFLMFEHIYELGLWRAEVETVNQSFPDVPLADRPLATRYLCWRRSVIGCSLVPYALSMILGLRALPDSLDKQGFLQSISPKTNIIKVQDYWGFFVNYFYVHAAVQVLYAASLVLSFAMMSVAYWSWARFSASRRWLRAAYLLSFAVPFMLLMIAPHKQMIDGDGAEKKLCEDMLERTTATFSRAEFNCTLPDAKMCTQPADRWSAKITSTLQGCGVMLDPQTDTCPFAERAAKQALAANSLASTTLTNAAKQLCTAQEACAPCIEAGPQACSNVPLAVAGPQSFRNRCARCFVPISAWRAFSPPTVVLTAEQWSKLNGEAIGLAGDPQLCAQLCAPLLAPALSSLYAEQLSTGRKQQFCVGEKTMTAINSVTALALHFDKVEEAVGVYQAILTLATLFPASFALMFGSIKGATVCKTMLPWSRLPGYILGASIVFCLPTFMALLAVMYQLLGNYFLMAAFIALLLSLLVWLPVGNLRYASAKGPSFAT